MDLNTGRIAEAGDVASPVLTAVVPLTDELSGLRVATSAARRVGMFGARVPKRDVHYSVSGFESLESVASPTRRVGFFAGGAGQAVEVSSSEAVNHINGLRLRHSLAVEQFRSVFTETGALVPDMVAGARQIIPGDNLANPRLIHELEAVGGQISDWGKYATRVISGPRAGDFEIHFYRNSVSGDVYYDRDYKLKSSFRQQSWEDDLCPRFNYDPLTFRR